MKEQTEAATVTVADGLAERADITTELIGQLHRIQGEIKNLPPANDGWGNPDEVVADCRIALDKRELEIHNEIRKLGGQGPLKRIKKRGWMGRMTEELVEDSPSEEGAPSTDR